MDIITYVPDIGALNAEGVLLANNPEHPLNALFSVDEDGALSFNVTKIPVMRTNDGQTLCLVRGLSPSNFNGVESIRMLGECVRADGKHRYAFLTPEDEATYKRARGPLEYEYELDGEKVKGTHSFMIGVFA